MDYRKLNHVLAELNSYAGEKKTVRDSTFVLCPYHSERTASGRIFHSANSKSPGFFKCYGCGTKSSWDELAPRLGLKPYTYTTPQELEARPVVRSVGEDQESPSFTHSPLPEGKLWRSVKTDLLTDIGCSLITQYNERFIYMPVNVRGTEAGYIRARLKKVKDKPSYLNKAGKWAESQGLFPYDYAVKMMRHSRLTTLVLVEGPRDALRLLGSGIPACAILGTQSWAKRKGHLVEMTGAELVITCFDGDCAGLQATKKVSEALEGLVHTKNFDLAAKDSPYWQFSEYDEPTKVAKQKGVELWDPGCMPLKKLKQLKSLVYNTT